MYSIAELKPGRAVVVEGNPYLIVWSQFSKKSMSRGAMVTKMRNLRTGAVISKTFQGSEKLEQADVGYRHVQYLYGDGHTYTFMDLTTYDQFVLDTETMGERSLYLREGMELDVLLFEAKPIDIQLPATVDLCVKETSPGVKGDTATGGAKPATLESGLTLQVPLFVRAGDAVRVNTETGEYMGRV